MTLLLSFRLSFGLISFSFFFHRGFGMRQQAVELALKVDPTLARELAQDSVELEERKRLWLMIAKNAASEGVHGGDVDVVSKVVSVLKDCGPDVLSIEDVRPIGTSGVLRNSFGAHRWDSPCLFFFHHRSSPFCLTLLKLTKSKMRFAKHLLPTLPRSKAF